MNPAKNEYGIIYSPPMVIAKLAGIKTQTRRMISPQPILTSQLGDEQHDGRKQYFVEDGKLRTPARYGSIEVRCPYGMPGDLSWGRESHAFVPWASGAELHAPDQEHDRTGVRYKATWDRSHSGRWRPSIHMHRWASRILDEIVQVRVQRIQDITEAEAIAEGVRQVTKDGKLMKYCVYNAGFKFDMSTVPWSEMPRTARECYAHLWDELHGAGAWKRNDWVWALTMKPIQIATVAA